MMRTVAIINQKGGCGKTTTAVNLSACLARLGQKTLLVDMDPQGHCAVGLAVPEEQIERSLIDSLTGEDGRDVPVESITWQIATDFDLAPSHLKLAAFEQLFAGKPGRESRLKEALSRVKDRYQWCIIDCPPSVGLLTFNALFAADEVIVPVETGYFSLHGLSKVIETIEELKDAVGKETQVRILPTLYDTRTKLAREVLAELRQKFRGMLMSSVVNFNTKLKEAASFGQPITEYDPGSRGYKDFINLARELMGQRPVEADAGVGKAEQMTRPQELVQRAKQLAQMTNVKFGRPGSSGGGRPASPMISGPATPMLQLVTDDDEGGIAVMEDPGMLAEEQSELEISRRIEQFYGVRQVGEETVFQFRFDEARRVLIAGDFNNWSAMSTPMDPVAPGVWNTRLPLRPGRYQYRLVVDGKWMTDPHNARVERNEFGELNNVVEVG